MYWGFAALNPGLAALDPSHPFARNRFETVSNLASFFSPRL